MTSKTGHAVRHPALALCVLLATTVPAIAGELHWHEMNDQVQWRGQKLLVLENEFVSITLLPQAGGRVVRYVDRSTGLNQLHENPDLESPDAGGIWDREGIWSTSNISNLPFTYKVQHESAEIEAIFEADLGNLRITKKYRLGPASTRLTLETVYRNTGPMPIRTLFSQTFSLAPGGTTGSADYVVYPEGEGLVKMGYGSNLPIVPTSVSPSWWIASDSRQGVSLLLTFEPGPSLAERTIGWGAGAIELELHTRRGLLNPGEAVTLRWDMRLIKQASDIRQACTDGCFLPQSEREAMGQSLAPLIQNADKAFSELGEQTVVLPWGFVSLSVPRRVVTEFAPLEAEVRAVRFASGDTSQVPSGTLHMLMDRDLTDEFPLGDLGPGTAKTWYWRSSNTKLVDGRHSLRIEVGGHGTAASFAAIDEAGIAARIEKAQKRSAELAQEARRSGDASRVAASASCEMRAEDARRKFILGPAFVEWGNDARGVDVNKLPLKLNADAQPSDVEYILRVLAETEDWINDLAAGHDPFLDRKGLFQKAFYSKVDGSLEPYTVYVPKDYDEKTARPLVLLLHGSGGDQWEVPQAAANLDGRSVFRGALEEKLQEPKFLYCAPLARGASGYGQIAEVDLIQMLDEVQRDYRVDPDRVYVMGWSMGGLGSYLAISRFSDRLAATMPIAGFADTDLVANGLYVPALNVQGLEDRSVSDGSTSVAENAYNWLGLPYHDLLREIPFVWTPWSDHWIGYRMTGSLSEIESILGKYQRVKSPKTVKLVSTELHHNQSYWVRIDEFDRYYEPASLKASIQDNTIVIDSANVHALTLLLSPDIVDMSNNVRVKQNGRVVYEGKPETELRIGSLAGPGIHKYHGLSGPLSDIFYEPFLVVYGTQGDDKQAIEVAHQEAEAIRTEGLHGLRYYGILIKSDREVTAADIENYHLLLIGTPGSNLLLMQIQDRLPVRFQADELILGDRKFRGEDVGVRLIYPNPLNPRKYVEVLSGITAKGLTGLASIASPGYGWMDPVVEPDIIVTNQRANGFYPTYLAALTFGNDWKLENRDKVVGQLEVPLSRTGIESTWGDFRADAIRDAARADIAILDVDDQPYPLELPAGAVTQEELSLMNNRAPVYVFRATGAELLGALEKMIERYLVSTRQLEEDQPGEYPPNDLVLTRRPPAVSGFSYAFYRFRSEGERVVATGLDPIKEYRVAITEHVLTQSTDSETGPGYLGWLPEIERLPMTETDAQKEYLRGHSPITAVKPRIAEY